jgi:hypothetical protein
MIPTSTHLVRFNDNLLQILRYYPEARVRDVDGIKKWLNADIAIRREGIMYFCQTIEDAVEIDDQVEVPKRGRPKKIK